MGVHRRSHLSAKWTREVQMQLSPCLRTQCTHNYPKWCNMHKCKRGRQCSPYFKCRCICLSPLCRSECPPFQTSKGWWINLWNNSTQGNNSTLCLASRWTRVWECPNLTLTQDSKSTTISNRAILVSSNISRPCRTQVASRMARAIRNNCNTDSRSRFNSRTPKINKWDSLNNIRQPSLRNTRGTWPSLNSTRGMWANLLSSKQIWTSPRTRAETLSTN